MASFGIRRLCLGLLTLAWAGAAQAQSTEDAAAVTRGQRAVSWIQGYECPRPGRAMTVQGLSTDAEIQQRLTENWSFIQNSVAARQQALRQRDAVALDLQVSGSRPPASLQRSFAELEGALNTLDYRVANAEAQWALANYVLMSRAPAEVNLLNGQANPLADFIPVVQSLEALSGQFGEPAQQVFRRFRDCWISANDVYLDNVGPMVRERVRQARTLSDIDRLLAIVAVVPTNSELPGGQVVAEAQTKRVDIEAEIQRQAELQRAASDRAARERLEHDANATLSVASRYVNLISRGSVGDASALLASNVRLYSPRGDASGRSAVMERMRSASQSGEQVNMQAPRIGSDYRVESRISSSQGSGTMSFQSANGLITVIELRQ